MSVFDYRRRPTIEVDVAGVRVGGDNPIVIQTMTNTSTNDIEGSVDQIVRARRAGAQMVRLTAQGVREVHSLEEIKARVREAGYDTPIIADIHFNTAAAFAAADVVDKVRINPGNFVDPGRVFKQISYSDEEYAQQLELLNDKVLPFFELCKKNGVAVRIGVNHGSLSDRIMSRFGDTPAGMVESAMEFLRIARKTDFNDIVISIKSSNTKVMDETVRRLAAAMDAEDFHMPLHLGVTEAGEGEDGRIKSAVGIGTLLLEGLGDTIRVSLSEDPVNEIPVAKELTDYVAGKVNAAPVDGEFAPGFNRFSPARRTSTAIDNIGGDNPPVVISPIATRGADPRPDIVGTQKFVTLDTSIGNRAIIESIVSTPGKPVLLTTSHTNNTGAVKSAIHAITAAGLKVPVAVKFSYPDTLSAESVTIRAAADFGSLLIDGLIDGMLIDAPHLSADIINNLAFGILQGSRARFTKTEYIACPGCGRTLFDLPTTLKKIKEHTGGLKGLKIGVMGCVVNGPGEMADADYGYVGAAKGKVSLYRGKECIERNIPEEQAVDKLLDLMRNDNKIS